MKFVYSILYPVLSLLFSACASAEISVDSQSELIHHEDPGVLLPYCQNGMRKTDPNFCDPFESLVSLSQEENLRRLCKEHEPDSTKCCACGGGKKGRISNTIIFNSTIQSSSFSLTETGADDSSSNCLDLSTKSTKKIPLEFKQPQNAKKIRKIDDSNVDNVVLHLCNLNIDALINSENNAVMSWTDQDYTSEQQFLNGNAVIVERAAVFNFKPGTTSIQLMYSSSDGRVIYRFPFLKDLMPIIQEHILTPLKIPQNQILRMVLANMPEGSTINFHSDRHAWVRTSHRVHIPLITDESIFFIARPHQQKYKNQPIKEDEFKGLLRIKSNGGEVFEFNNAVGHAVRNVGEISRVHLIIDWLEEPVVEDKSREIIELERNHKCYKRNGSLSLLDCFKVENFHDDVMNVNDDKGVKEEL